MIDIKNVDGKWTTKGTGNGDLLIEKAKYPCAIAGCEVMRTESQGGKIFSVCDEHWEETFKKSTMMNFSPRNHHIVSKEEIIGVLVLMKRTAKEMSPMIKLAYLESRISELIEQIK